MLAAALRSVDPNCALTAIFVAFGLLFIMLEPIVDVLVALLDSEPPVAEEVRVPKVVANAAEMLLACTVSIFAPHGLVVPGVPPSCGHPVQLATMPNCPAKVEQFLVKTGEAPPSFTVKLMEP